MGYLLDTNILIYFLRNPDKTLDPEWLKAGCAISVITEAELCYGAHKSNQPQENSQQINYLLNDLRLTQLPTNSKICRTFAKLKASLEITGKRLEDFDLLIAATALEHNLTLITHNAKHFKRIPHLKLLKP